LVVDSADALRYGLYVITVVLGLSLFFWVRRSGRIRRENLEVVRNTEPVADHSRPSGVRVHWIPSNESMAEALAGIRLPVHWRPDPADEVMSRLTLTTWTETAGEMAELLSDELVRLGYHVRPTGPRSARATRATNRISIEVETAESDSSVSSLLILSDAADG
jgi:hypothetical protein